MTTQLSEQAVAAREQGRQPDGKFGPTVAPEAETDLTAPIAPAPMSHEDHRFLAAERAHFASGYTSEDVDRLLEDIEGAEMVVVWDTYEDGMFTGDSQIVGRVGDGPWRPVSEQLWDHLTTPIGGETLGGDSCTECGAECVVEEDGTSHHLTPEGEVDHDADADHVALDDSEMAEATGATGLAEGTPLLADEPFENQYLDGHFRSGANIALEVEEDEQCECGEELDGDGADGRCGSCTDQEDRAVLAHARSTALEAGKAWRQDPTSPRASVNLQVAAGEFVDTAVDRGGDYDEVDNAWTIFAAEPSNREKGEALIAALERFDIGEDDDDDFDTEEEDDYDPDVAYAQMVKAGYSPKLADDVARSASSYDSAFEMVTLAGGR